MGERFMATQEIVPERGGIPLYARLTEILKTQIRSGIYKPKGLLPTEEQLSEKFGVSRITVREALRLLADDGIIVRRSGKGTFVAEPSEPVIRAACTIDDLLLGPQESSRRLISRKVIPADPISAEHLQIPLGTKVVEFQRLAYMEGTPLIHITLTVPHNIGCHISAKRLGERTLVQLLTEGLGIQLSHVDQWTTASLADTNTATLLGISVGNPILTIERVFLDNTGRPVEFAVNRYPSHPFRHHIRLEWERRLGKREKAKTATEHS
jgi:GntR family transcriptional regulator